MIWNAWVLALMIGQIGILCVNAVAFLNALRIVRRWDVRSYAPEQLELERRSELIATIISWSLLFEILSLVVFELTARTLTPFIPGAMCAIGVFGADAWGYPSLYVKILGLFVYGFWVVLHHIDENVEGFPLTRFKNTYGLFLFPYLVLDVTLQFLFFIHLDPNVITSCCGVVFEVGGQSYASSVASLPPRETRWILVGYLGGFLFLSYVFRWEARRIGRLLHGFFSTIGFFLGIAAIIAFTAPYVYQMPALHCPFCILKRENFCVGYLFYLPLFLAAFFGITPGVLNPLLRRYPKAQWEIATVQTRMIRWSRIFWILFMVAAFMPMIVFLVRSGGIDLFFGQSFR